MDKARILDSLRSTGLAVVGALRPAEVAEVNVYLAQQPIHINAHVAQTARRRGEVPAPRSDIIGAECLCLASEHDALCAPHLLERALALTDLVAARLERDPPLLYSSNAFWTRPGPEPLRWDIQEFHKDEDDERFLVMFTYLTDVRRPEDGAHCLIGPDGEERTILGSAGTIFLAETSNLHLGRKPMNSERGIHWFRWGVSDPPASYVWDGLTSVPHTRLGGRYPEKLRLRESIHLLISPPQ